MTTKAEKAAEQIEACKALRKILRPGQRVGTILRHVSSSGMSRRISVIAAEPDYETRLTADGEPKRYLRGYQARNISWLVARACGRRYNRDEGSIVIGGCGMDMGFAIIYDLGHALWPKGTGRPHGFRNGEPDTAGGYALKHEWL